MSQLCRSLGKARSSEKRQRSDRMSSCVPDCRREQGPHAAHVPTRRCTHAHTCTRMRAHRDTCACTHPHMQTHMHTRAHTETHMHTEAHTCTPRRTHTHTCAHTGTCTHTRAQRHTHGHTCTCTQIHMHTHRCTHRGSRLPSAARAGRALGASTLRLTRDPARLFVRSSSPRVTLRRSDYSRSRRRL